MKVLDIGEVAALSGFKTSALRYYEAQGLISPLGRHGLRRQYADSVLQTLSLIALGRHAGFSLDDIREMLGPQGSVSIDREKMRQKAQEVGDTIKHLTLIQKTLAHVADCPAEDHLACASFRKLLKRVNRNQGAIKT
ncbi:MerR family transcriptional regulator [Terasakiispira papahanaumokuakeensis]|uniref:MerR family transcriptional regulator n=1 Tax=Terasakiispira papahanaumokuakeensis TaxID=197479 RepID=A0A1E2V8B0_9GAMM|nr:helix-turn-helix domain-containing protein [Terasakiispira papahanaumokuakeensis]ODC03204.1 MerR family transcriptional regulator [Terasakiispira papahanaumokuakeensis]